MAVRGWVRANWAGIVLVVACGRSELGLFPELGDAGSGGRRNDPVTQGGAKPFSGGAPAFDGGRSNGGATSGGRSANGGTASGGRSANGGTASGGRSANGGTASGGRSANGGRNANGGSGGFTSGGGASGDGGFAGAAGDAGSAGECSVALFEPAREIAVGVRPVDIATSDLNGDGRADLVALNEIQDFPLVYGSLSVLLGHGDGTFENTELSGPRRAPTALAFADFDADGRQDLVVTHAVVVDKVTLSLGRGDGTFATPSELTVTGDSQADVAIGDINADGRPDLVVTNQYSHNLTVLLNEGGTGFRSIPIASNAQPKRVALAHLDHDGALDLVVGVWALGGTRVIPMRGSGLGAFAPFPALDPGVYPSALAVADLDRDDHPDLVVAGTNAVHVRRGLDAILEYDAGRSFALDEIIGGLAVADLDRDGNLDVAVTRADLGQVFVLFGAGDATFSRQERFDVGVYPVRLVAADLNGDGRPDLAVANRDSNSVSILLASARRACR